MNLFISTATDKIYIMVFKNDLIIEQKIYQGKNNHTEKLYGLLQELETNLDDIKRIYVVNGPGSYTGLRVGVIFAKTMAMLNEIEIYPVGLMPALFHSNGEKEVFVDAKGKKYYRYSGDEISLVSQEMVSGLIDPLIDLEALIKSKYLEELKAVNYLELTIEYVKSAI